MMFGPVYIPAGAGNAPEHPAFLSPLCLGFCLFSLVIGDDTSKDHCDYEKLQLLHAGIVAGLCIRRLSDPDWPLSRDQSLRINFDGPLLCGLWSRIHSFKENASVLPLIQVGERGVDKPTCFRGDDKMRILMVGAGGVGGYFGGRLVEKGADVTFLVRRRRKEQLREKGLVIHSVHGDFSSPVRTITAGEEATSFDLIILSVKAYHLEAAIRDIRPYVGDSTAILPLLNGMSHMDRLESVFGRGMILGGLCQIETTLNDRGEVEQYSPFHNIVFGELDGTITDRVRRLENLFSGAKMTAQTSKEILVEMWHKYVFIAAFSGMTSMMRSSIGPIMEVPWGKETYRRLAEEIAAVARFHEPSLAPEIGEWAFSLAAALDASMKSSMLRDVERGGPTETDHLHGWLIQTAPEEMDLPLLKAVYASIKAYEAGRNHRG